MLIGKQEDMGEVRKALLATLQLLSWEEELISSALDRLGGEFPPRGRRPRRDVEKSTKKLARKKKA